MHKKQNQFNSSGIKWPTEVDMPLNKTPTLYLPDDQEIMKVNSWVIFFFLILLLVGSTIFLYWALSYLLLLALVVQFLKLNWE